MDEPEAAEAGPRSPFSERRLPGPPEELAMDVDLIKVLSSDSRREILRHLRSRRMTLTELAAALDLKKATVLEHLKKLTDAGLIRRLEDERLWVYYELTHRGGRIVNPSRTRFYLLMSVGAAAALVMGGVVTAVLVSDLAPDVRDGSALDARIVDPPHLAAGSVSAGGVSVDLYFGETSPSGARAYLVTASDAAHLRDTDGAVVGIPLGLEGTNGTTARFRSQAAVPPGNYYLYVVDSTGRDNLDSLSEVRVPSLAAEGPAVVWRGIDGPQAFRLARDDAPARGTLLLAAGDGRELPTLALHNGSATLDERTLDRLVPTTYALQYLPEGSQFWIALDRSVEVREPLNALEPLYALEGRPTTFRVALTGGEPAPPTFLSAEDDRVDASYAAFGNAAVEATLVPRGHDTLDLQAGRLAPHAVRVVPDLRISMSFMDNETVSLRVTDPEGRARPELAVGLGNRTLDLTGANGTVQFPRPEDGAHELRLVQPDGSTVSRALLVSGSGIVEEPDRVRVENTTARHVGETLEATAMLLNAGAARELVTLALVVDGRTVATRAVDAPPASVSNVTLAARVKLSPGEHGVRVQAIPLAHEPLQGAWTLSNATMGTEDRGAVVATSGATGRSTYLYARDTSGDEVRVQVQGPAPPVLEKVQLAPRATSAPPATPDAAAASERATPGAGLALVLAGALVAIAARRRR